MSGRPYSPTLYQINQIRNSLTSRFGARSKSGEVKPRRQRGATAAIGGDGGNVVAQE